MKSRKVYGIILMISMMTMFVLSGCGGCSCGESDDDGSCIDCTCANVGACMGCVSACSSVDGCEGVKDANEAYINGYQSGYWEYLAGYYGW